MFPQTIACPAKVNWTLKVGPRLESGFHQVETQLLALSLHDVLKVDLDASLARGSFALEIDGPAFSPDIPTDGSNLILRAAERVATWQAQAMLPLPSGLRFRLVKNIPSQAGLGGGSSNAAAAAVALLQGLEVHANGDFLLSLLAQLGSDCPFFGHVLGGDGAPGPVRNRALGHGQGQWILPATAPAPPMNLCIITPDVACPTGAIYGALEPPRAALASHPEVREWGEVSGERGNDLEAAALAAVPALQIWRQALSDFGGGAFQLSGSGASFYAVIPEDRSRELWVEELLRFLSHSGLSPRFHWSGSLWLG